MTYAIHSDPELDCTDNIWIELDDELSDELTLLLAFCILFSYWIL